MQMVMKEKKHRKPMKDQRRLCRTNRIVLESVNTGQNISDIPNKILAKQVQWHAMYLKGRLHCNIW
jgi:hypothetical protein